LEDLNQQFSSETIASPSVVRALIRSVLCKTDFNLTEREKQIIALSALGCTVPLIALKLNIAKYTVEEYIKNIKIRLDTNTIHGVVGKALYHQCIDLKRYAQKFQMELD
jgi:DNA-binding CsgD family transcriptional regulator